MKKLIVILISVVSLTAGAQNEPIHLNALAVNGINVRSQANVNSRVLTKVPFGKRVQILEDTKQSLQLGWVRSNWYKVRFRGREGFVFGGYLSDLAVPREINQTRQLSELIPMYCKNSLGALGNPIYTAEKDYNGDTLHHTFQKFENGFELELERTNTDHVSKLLVPYSIQETYVLLESLLKLSGNKQVLNELRFVKGKNGDLSRINTPSGSVQITSNSQNQSELRLMDNANGLGQAQR